MSNDQVLLTAGQIIGMLARLTVPELTKAANSPGLDPAYQRTLLELARCHEALGLSKGLPTREGK